MKTVVLRLRFTTPCLGNRKDDSQSGLMCHLRDGQGRIVFLQSWWNSALAQSAKAMGRHQEDVRRIRWSPIVDGCPQLYMRFYRHDKAQAHEAFRAGDEVSVKAMIPPSISTSDFRQLMDLLGEFYGISPYRNSISAKGTDKSGDGGYGRFEVVEVRDGSYYSKTNEHVGDQPGNSLSAFPGSGPDVSTD